MLPSEAKEILNFPGYYVTSNGSVWSGPNQRWHGYRELKWGLSTSGYPQVSLCRNNRRHQQFVHRAVLETFIGPCPKGMLCCHKNDIKMDNNIKNLRWDTPSANNFGAYKNGKIPTDVGGEKNGRAKLNILQVRVIKRLLEFNTLTQIEISNIFGITSSAISRINRGITWKGV